MAHVLGEKPQQCDGRLAKGRQHLKSIGLQMRKWVSTYSFLPWQIIKPKFSTAAGLTGTFQSLTVLFLPQINVPQPPYVSISGDFTWKHSAFFAAWSLVFHKKSNISWTLMVDELDYVTGCKLCSRPISKCSVERHNNVGDANMETKQDLRLR